MQAQYCPCSSDRKVKEPHANVMKGDHCQPINQDYLAEDQEKFIIPIKGNHHCVGNKVENELPEKYDHKSQGGRSPGG